MNPVSYVLPVLYIVLQIPFLYLFNNTDINEARFNYWMVIGAAGIVYSVWSKKIPHIYICALPLLIYCVTRGLASWVPGYTIYELGDIVGMFGVMLLASNSNIKAILVVLALSILIQVGYTYLPIHILHGGTGSLWYENYALIGDFNMPLYGWGTVRHRIRFATLMLAGVIACYTLYCDVYDKKKRMQISKIEYVFESVIWGTIGCIGLAAIAHSFSNTVIALLALFFCFVAIQRFDKIKSLIIMGSIGIALYVANFKYGGFSLDDGRLQVWNALLGSFDTYLSVWIGHGIGSWDLMSGLYGGAGHPHNEFLLGFFEIGIIGIVCLICFLLMTIITAKINMLRILFLLISLSFLTNSMTDYADMWVLWSVIAGMCLKEEIEYD